MQQFRTRGIVLKRVNYAESDRIVTFLTFDQGIVAAMVKGSRKQNSKLAGGIELFTESDLTFIQGKGELNHLISSRSIVYFKNIVSDYERVELTYGIIKFIYKAASHFNEPKLYKLLVQSLEALNKRSINTELIEAWFKLNLLKILGQQPNLTHDINNQKLESDKNYTLLPDDGAFKEDKNGEITSDIIKSWRVLIISSIDKAQSITNLEQAVFDSLPKIRLLFEYQFV